MKSGQRLKWLFLILLALVLSFAWSFFLVSLDFNIDTSGLKFEPTMPSYNERIVIFLKFYEEPKENRIDFRQVYIAKETSGWQNEIDTGSSSHHILNWSDLVKKYCYDSMPTSGFYGYYSEVEKIWVRCTLKDCSDEQGKIVPLLWLSPKPECP